MDIWVRGPRFGVVSPKSLVNEIERSVLWLHDYLEIERAKPSIDYQVVLSKQLSLKEEWHGSCYVTYEPGDLDWDIVITLNTLSSRQMRFVTLCHEMVHAKQFATGELSFNYDKYVEDQAAYVWKGRNLSSSDGPHEREAERLEYKLYNMLIDEGVIHGRRISTRTGRD